MPKYHIEVYEKDVRNRMFRYQVELHSSETSIVKYDWCSYKFLINRTARKLIRDQKAKDNVRLIQRFEIR